MTAMMPPAEVPREESYLEFVRRKFPDELHRIEGLPDLNDDTFWASSDFRPRNHDRQITIVDFQTVPRKMVLQFPHSPTLWKSGVNEMIDFFRKGPPSQGVLILWEYTLEYYHGMHITRDLGGKFWVENILVAALAEASFADPANISHLRQYWRTREELPELPDDILNYYQLIKSPFNPLQMLTRVSRNTRLRELNYLSNKQPRWLPLQSKHVLNLSSCRDTAVAQTSACQFHLPCKVL
jgi:hypothetical protein